MATGNVDVIAPKFLILPAINGNGTNGTLAACISGAIFISGAQVYVSYGGVATGNYRMLTQS
jgi:hypothetical protein